MLVTLSGLLLPMLLTSFTISSQVTLLIAVILGLTLDASVETYLFSKISSDFINALN